ncbi:MAG: hypothetical protein PV340_02075 [Wolbachia sp.]|nr:hypothetical protein [Wolbachia sp.]MDD9335996.1 hypothetical protein [Wolbachia sp.]
MPQLDVSTFFSQVFWFLIFFSSLFLVVSCVFLPKLDEIINTRNKGILDSFNGAVCLLKFTENQMGKYNAALYQAKIHAKRIIDNAVAQAEEMQANIKDILEEESKKMSKFVEEEIVKFKAEYVEELKQMSVNIALIYYTKLTNSQVKEEPVANLISKEY